MELERKKKQEETEKARITEIDRKRQYEEEKARVAELERKKTKEEEKVKKAIERKRQESAEKSNKKNEEAPVVPRSILYEITLPPQTAQPNVFSIPHDYLEINKQKGEMHKIEEDYVMVEAINLPQNQAEVKNGHIRLEEERIEVAKSNPSPKKLESENININLQGMSKNNILVNTEVIPVTSENKNEECKIVHHMEVAQNNKDPLGEICVEKLDHMKGSFVARHYFFIRTTFICSNLFLIVN